MTRVLARETKKAAKLRPSKPLNPQTAGNLPQFPSGAGSRPANGENGTPGQRSPALLAVGITVIVALVFALVPSFDFVRYDDGIHVFQNPSFQHFSSQSFTHFWLHPYENLYIPMSYMLFGILAYLGREGVPGASDTGALFNPHIFHVASVTLHIVNTLLVFALLRRLTKSDMPAAAGALLFGIHPLQVESVAWISELRGLLGTCFAFAAVLAYLNASTESTRNKSFQHAMQLDRKVLQSKDQLADTNSSSPEDFPQFLATGFNRWSNITSSKGRWTYVASLALFILALLSKPSVVTIPLVMLIIDRWVIGRSLAISTRSVLPFAVASIPFIFISRAVQTLPYDQVTPLWTRPLIAMDALAFYLGKLVAPVNLGIVYGRTPHFVLDHHYLYVTWIAPVLLGLLACALRRRFPQFAIGYAVAIAALLPTSGLMPFYFQHISTTADRYFYLPMLGVAYTLASIIKQYSSRLVVIIVTLAFVGLAGLSAMQSAVWSDTITLYENACKVDPNSSVLYASLAVGFVDHKQYPAAIEAQQKALALSPNDPVVHLSMAQDFEWSGDFPDALKEYDVYRTLNPADVTATYQIATLLTKLGSYSQAAAEYRRYLAAKPTDANAANDLGICLMSQGDRLGAISAFRQADELSPADPGYAKNLARALGAAK